MNPGRLSLERRRQGSCAAQADSVGLRVAQAETGAYEEASPIYGLFSNLNFSGYVEILSNDEMESHYSHRPLTANVDSFRLVRLCPARDPKAPLCCELQEAFVHSPPKYEALSYVWNPPKAEIEEEPDLYNAITISERYWLPITANCGAALRRLRLRTKPRLLFVDAICIDQRPKLAESQAERNQQVRLMGTIYSKARRVLVWLGEGSDETKAIFRYLHAFGAILWIEPGYRVLGPAFNKLIGSKG
jgi:hypothetical protein